MNSIDLKPLLGQGRKAFAGVFFGDQDKNGAADVSIAAGVDLPVAGPIVFQTPPINVPVAAIGAAVTAVIAALPAAAQPFARTAFGLARGILHI